MNPVLYSWLSEATIATAATTAATYIFTPSMLPSGRGVVDFQIRCTTVTATDITRVRVKAGSTVIFDIESEDHLQAFLQRITNGTFDLADADTAFSLPFYDPRFRDLSRYGGQFPYFLGAPQIEITINATPGAGTIGVSARITTVPMSHYHSFICSRLEIAASSTNARQTVNIPPASYLKGFSVNTTGLDRLQLTVNGNIVGTWTGVSLLAEQRLDNSDVLTNPSMAIVEASDATLAGIGGSEVLISSAAGWAGVANELGVWSLHPVR